VAIAVAVSRGAWLALAAAVAVLLAGALAGRERRAAVALAGVAGGAALAVGALALALPRGGVVLGALGQRARHFADAGGRQHIWQAAWDLFRDHPLVGTGLDSFQIAFADKRTAAYWTIEWNASPTRAHNEALNLLATQGLLGAVAVAVFTVGVLLAARRAWRAGGDRLLVVALAAGLAAFYVQDLFSFTVAGCGTLAVTLAALLSRLAEGGGDPPAWDGTEWLAGALVAGALIAGAVFALNLSPDLLLDEASCWWRRHWWRAAPPRGRSRGTAAPRSSPGARPGPRRRPAQPGAWREEASVWYCWRCSSCGRGWARRPRTRGSCSRPPRRRRPSRACSAPSRSSPSPSSTG
jgi:hypothetical protein